MNYMDVILGIPLLWALYKGFSKGLIIEVCSLAALILGVYGALHFSFYISEVLSSHFELSPEYLSIISFAVTFLGIVLSIMLLGKVLTKVVKVVALGMLNRVAGSLFSILKMGLILSVALLWVGTLNNNLKFIEPDVREKSILWNVLSPMATFAIPSFKEKGWGDWIEDVVPPKDTLNPVSL